MIFAGYGDGYLRRRCELRVVSGELESPRARRCCQRREVDLSYGTRRRQDGRHIEIAECSRAPDVAQPAQGFRASWQAIVRYAAVESGQTVGLLTQVE